MNITSIINDINKRLRALEVNQAKLPSRISSTSGRGGGEGSTWIIVDTFEDLPDPDDYAITKLAKIRYGTFGGGIAHIYDNGEDPREWHMLTHLE